MAKKKKKTKKVARKPVRSKKKVTSRSRFGVPALATLIKQPVRSLKSARDKIETAIEVKEAPGMFTDSGRRLFIGPRKPKGYKPPKKVRYRRVERLPAEIASITRSSE
jgi:hypothetical protein